MQADGKQDNKIDERGNGKKMKMQREPGMD